VHAEEYFLMVLMKLNVPLVLVGSNSSLAPANQLSGKHAVRTMHCAPHMKVCALRRTQKCAPHIATPSGPGKKQLEWN
jgi:hypothetical protein